MTPRRLLLVLCALCVSVLFTVSHSVQASTASDATLRSLQAEIDSYTRQLVVLGAQKVTLQSTINSLTLEQKKLTAQIKITQNNISAANVKIGGLTDSISDKQATIDEHKNAIAKALRRLAENESASLVTQIIASNSLHDAWQAADVTMQFNRALQNDIVDLHSAQVVLAANRDQVTLAKTDLVSLQKDLNAQNKSVAQNKAQQQDLLKQTKSSETNFQKLLAAAKAELASFSAFTTAAGGAKLLADQTVCDTWGCYYNQRDTLWGNLRLNNTQYKLASDGCLVTAMAMVITHYGYRDVTPVTINANPNNFAAYYPAYMLFTTYVNGITAKRVTALIDSTLSSGDPVIVGVHAYGGTHFVVIVGGRRGAYVMRDPYIANGKDINFSDHYTLNSIYAVNKVIISS